MAKLDVQELQLLISANADQFHSELQKIQQDIKSLNKTTQEASDKTGGQLFKNVLKANLATNVITAGFREFRGILGTVNRTIGESITATNKYESAILGLSSVASRKLGTDAIDDVTRAAEALASDGLMSVTEASTGLKNLLATGFNLEQANNLMLTFKDSAAFGRQAALGFGESISSATEGVKNGNSILVDNAGITKNLSNILTEAGYSQQDLNKATSDANVRMAIYNGLLREGLLFQGDAAKLANTTAGQMSKISVALFNIRRAIGEFIKPIQTVVLSGLASFFAGVNGTLSNSATSIRNFSVQVAGYLLGLVRTIGALLSKIPVIGQNFAGMANLTLKASAGVNNLTSSSGAYSDAINNAAKGTAALNKQLNQLAGFDEMNVLQAKDSGSGASPELDTSMAGMGGGANVDFGLSEDEVNQINDRATSVIDTFKEIDDTIKRIMDNPIVKFIVNLATAFGGLLLGAKLVSGVIGLVTGGLGPLQGIISIVTGAVSGLAAILGITVGTLLSWLAVIALIVAGLVSLYQNNESFRNSIDQLVNGALKWIQENIAPVFDKFVQKAQELIAVFQEKWPAIQAAIQPLIDSIANFLVGAFQLLGKIIDWLWKTILKPLVDFILDNIVPAFSIAIDIITGVIKIFSDLASKIIDLIMPILNTLWDVFTQVFDGIKSVVEFVWNNILKPIFQALYDFVTKLIIPVVQNIFAVFSLVFNKVREIVEDVWSRIRQAIQPVIDWISNNIMPVVNKFKEQFENVWNGIKTTIENIWNGITNTIKGAINGVIDLINGFIRHINDLISSVSSVAESIPGGSKIDFRVGYIGHLATGGLVTKPVVSQLGEGSFREAVLPLDRNTEWAEIVADRINKAGGSGGNSMPIILQIGDKKIAQFIIDTVNRRALETNSVVFNT